MERQRLQPELCSRLVLDVAHDRAAGVGASGVQPRARVRCGPAQEHLLVALGLETVEHPHRPRLVLLLADLALQSCHRLDREARGVDTAGSGAVCNALARSKGISDGAGEEGAQLLRLCLLVVSRGCSNSGRSSSVHSRLRLHRARRPPAPRAEGVHLARHLCTGVVRNRWCGFGATQ